ncbi:hypothetical protein ACJMK2_021964, partial [Sinanodonta woodiana]
MAQSQSLRSGNMQSSLSDNLQSTRRSLLSPVDQSGSDLMFPFSPISGHGSPCEIPLESTRSSLDCLNDISMDSCSYPTNTRNFSEGNRPSIGFHSQQTVKSGALDPYSNQATVTPPTNNSFLRQTSLSMQSSSPYNNSAAVTSSSCQMHNTPSNVDVGANGHQQNYGSPRNRCPEPGSIAPKLE